MDVDQIVALELILFGILSIASCSFIIYCYIKFQELRNDAFFIIINILIFDLINSLSLTFVGIFYFNYLETGLIADKYGVLCNMQSFCNVFGVVASCAWTSIVCHNLHKSVIDDDHSFSKMYYVIGYVMPVIISIIPWILGYYGVGPYMQQSNCWFKPAEDAYIRIWIFFLTPIYLSFLYNTVIIIIVVIKLRNLPNIRRNTIYGLFAYPSILAICWIIPESFDQTHYLSEHPNLAQLLFPLSTLPGLLDSFAYCHLVLFSKITIKGYNLELISEVTDKSLDLTLMS